MELIEKVLQRENMMKALKRVVRNSGAPGVDGMTVDELAGHCKTHWPQIRENLRNGRYTPQPVRKVDIPKPNGKGVRILGIPTVLDRLIQQAVAQVLTPIYDPTFSDASYGFRPGRSTHDALRAAKRHVADGYRWVVDIDLEKYFDRINHDVLMARLARRIDDKRLLLLIRRFLQAGGHGRRGSETEGRGGAARRSSFSFVKQHHARRSGPGAKPPWTPLRPLCRRYECLRANRRGWAAGDGIRYAVSRKAATLESQPIEKHRGPPLGTNIPRVSSEFDQKADILASF